MWISCLHIQHINATLLYCIETKHQTMYLHVTANGHSFVEDLRKDYL